MAPPTPAPRWKTEAARQANNGVTGVRFETWSRMGSFEGGSDHLRPYGGAVDVTDATASVLLQRCDDRIRFGSGDASAASGSNTSPPKSRDLPQLTLDYGANAGSALAKLNVRVTGATEAALNETRPTHWVAGPMTY
jgi:hypothetical protein